MASGARAAEPEMTSGSYLDLDLHADAAVLGNNCHIFQSSTGHFVSVYGYDIALGGHKRAIVSGCVAYDDHHTGRTVLLIVHQGLRVPGAAHSMIPPFQMRDNDIVVNDCPKSQCKRPTANNHSLNIPKLMGMNPAIGYRSRFVGGPSVVILSIALPRMSFAIRHSNVLN
jgi:hypothetical protein